jgi:hypothetical protein
MTHPVHPTVATPALVDHEQAAALERLRAAFGPVQVVTVHPHDPQPDLTSAPDGVQGCLLDQEPPG